MSISDSWATTVAPTTNVTKQAAEEARSWIPGVIVFIAALLAFIILATPVQLNGAPYKVTYNETTSDIKCIANEDLPDPRYADEDKVEGACTTTTTALSDAGALGIGFVAIFAVALAVLLAIASAVKESTRKVAAAMVGFGIIMIVSYELLKGSVDESKLDIAARGGIAALLVLAGLYAGKRLVQSWFQPKSS